MYILFYRITQSIIFIFHLKYIHFKLIFVQKLGKGWYSRGSLSSLQSYWQADSSNLYRQRR